MSLVTAERETYEAVWALNGYKDYAPGEGYIPQFLDMARPAKGQTVLDAGCGTGKGGLKLAAAGFAVTLCDLTAEGLTDEAEALPFTEVSLWHDLHRQLPYRWGGKFDWVYCCDVLEHIPPTFTMLVVHRLLAITRKGLFLSISTRTDDYGAWVGKALHQTVQPFTAWREQLSEVGQLVECRDLLHSGLYLVMPR